MIKKAIILCGGTGSRMFPLTYSINKQLLPIFDKPMFYYPLSLMMLCGIKEYIFVINKGQEENFRKLYQSRSNFINVIAIDLFNYNFNSSHKQRNIKK